MESRHGRGYVPMRREFLLAAAPAVGLALAACATDAAGRRRKDREEEIEISPGEDLMQEHGVLERVLLIYEEVARRIDAGERFDAATVTDAAGIVRRFIEGYHEKNEEQFVFPRLRGARGQDDLVAVLLRQHQRGREITDAILRAARGGGNENLAKLLRGFSRMYRPHAAREDTVLFPAFRELVGQSAYRELGEQFERKEHELLGEHGFEDTVAEVTRLEQTLGIDDLGGFTVP
jgi:hemerythrin-like domain-containing protein